MNRIYLFFIVAITICSGGSLCAAAQMPPVSVALQRPEKDLKMGDVPEFTGHIINTGNHPLQGLVVYLSLVSLQRGHEHPVDLEDWSAQKAVRIEQLDPGKPLTQKWPLRLIQAGRFALALTIIDPAEKMPVISALVPFDVMAKATVVSGRILPVAIGEPLLLAFLFTLFYRRDMGFRRRV